LDSKIKSREEIKKIVADLRKENPKIVIVTTNGAFDILHAGHAKSMELAKSFGNVLIVGLNSDSSIQQYKSKDRPIIPQKYRAQMLAALAAVDYVTIFDETTSIEFVKSIKPNIHVKSKNGFTGVENDAVIMGGGRMELIEDTPGISTTQIINKIKILLEKENKIS